MRSTLLAIESAWPPGNEGLLAGTARPLGSVSAVPFMRKEVADGRPALSFPGRL